MHPVHIPHEQVNDESVLLIDWLVADGGEVKPGQPIAIIETSKATAEIDAPQGGYLRHRAAKDTEVPVGAVFCYIAASPSEAVPAESTPARPAEVPAAAGAGADAHFSRRALELMEQHGIAKDRFKGRGMVRESDVLALVGAGPTAGAASGEAGREALDAAAVAGRAVPATGVPVRTEALPRMKRIEARYLASGRDHTLASSVTVVCPTAGLKAATRLVPQLGGNPTAVILYETARLLRKYPVFNAFFDQGKVSYYEQVNIGLAVDSGQGLKVPVVAHADKKGLIDIAQEVEGLLLDYLNDELPVATLAGGTFTVTDLSSEDVILLQPLINQGQAAILGIGTGTTPIAGPACFNLVLAFDHQLTEGRAAAIFLRELRDRINSYEPSLPSGGETPTAHPTCSRCRRPVEELAQLHIPLLEEIRAAGEKALICRDCLLGK